MNWKWGARSQPQNASRFRCIRTVGIVFGLVSSLSFAVLAVSPKEEQDWRSQDFWCGDFLQSGPLKKWAARQHSKRCNTPTAQKLANVIVKPCDRLLQNMPIVHSIKFGDIEAETYEDMHCNINKRLKISRKGKVYIDELLTSRFPDTWILNDREEQCFFYNIGVDQIRDLDGDREPEILVTYHTKGAHCCAGLLIYHYDLDRDKYHALSHYFGELGYQETKGLKDLDGDRILEFDVPDDSLFWDYKILIAEIWQYRQGRMYDVTRRFPNEVRQTAFTILEHYRSLTDEAKTNWYGRGRLSAYLAYKYMLGEAEDGWQKVRQIYPGADREEVLSNIKEAIKELGYIPGTHTERVDLEPEPTEIKSSRRGLAPNQKQRHLLNAKAGQQLTVKLSDIAFEKGTIEIRLLTPQGRLLGTLDRYQQRRWQGKLPRSGDYVIEVYSPTGAKYSLEFDVLQPQ